jgi:hypothetical protein
MQAYIVYLPEVIINLLTKIGVVEYIANLPDYVFYEAMEARRMGISPTIVTKKIKTQKTKIRK